MRQSNSRYEPPPRNTTRQEITINDNENPQTTGAQLNLNIEALNALKGISNTMQNDSEVKSKLTEAILLMSKSQKRERNSETAEEEEPILLDGMFEIKLERMMFESSGKSWKVQLKLERSIEVGKFNRIWKDNAEKRHALGQ